MPAHTNTNIDEPNYPVPARLHGTVLVSAHKGGVGLKKHHIELEDYKIAANSGAELVEFDVRTTKDGKLVCFHDDTLADGRTLSDISLHDLRRHVEYRVPEVEEVLRVLKDKVIAHVDLKEVGYEGRVIELLDTVVGRSGYVLTTLEDSTVIAVKQRYPGVQIGLSLGRGIKGLSLLDKFAIRRSEFFPTRRLLICRPDFVVVEQHLARRTLLSFAKSIQLPIWVWTVDEKRAVRRFIDDPRITVLITNKPNQALAMRKALRKITDTAD